MRALKLPVEFARHYAHHRKILAIDLDGVADQSTIRTITALPESVTQDHFVIFAPYFFLGQKRAPQKRLHAEHLEKTGRHPQPRNLLRLPAASAGG